VTISIFNGAGKLVMKINQGSQAEGAYKTEWNGTDINNSPVASGIFFYRITAMNWKWTSMMTNKMVVIR
jgi:flagellar hook assembly protein FlgD